MKKIFWFHVKLSLPFLLFFPLLGLSQHFSTTVLESRSLPAFPRKLPQIEASYANVPAFSQLGASQKEWFYWTNYSRLKPKVFWDSVVLPILQVYPQLNTNYAKSLKRDLYNQKEVPPFLPNPTLLKTSQNHADDLSRRNASPSHNSTNGTSFERRISTAGIQRCAAENLSFGAANTVLALVFLYIDEGLPDLGHRQALLNPYYTQLGIGVSTYKNKSVMVVQDFACDQEQ